MDKNIINFFNWYIKSGHSQIQHIDSISDYITQNGLEDYKLVNEKYEDFVLGLHSYLAEDHNTYLYHFKATRYFLKWEDVIKEEPKIFNFHEESEKIENRNILLKFREQILILESTEDFLFFNEKHLLQFIGSLEDIEEHSQGKNNHKAIIEFTQNFGYYPNSASFNPKNIPTQYAYNLLIDLIKLKSIVDCFIEKQDIDLQDERINNALDLTREQYLINLKIRPSKNKNQITSLETTNISPTDLLIRYIYNTLSEKQTTFIRCRTCQKIVEKTGRRKYCSDRCSARFRQRQKRAIDREI